MKQVKYSLGLWAFTPCTDRFATTGYRPTISPEDQIRLAGRVKGLSGVILQYPTGVNEENAESIIKLLSEEGLEVAAVDANLFGARFQNGSFTATARSKREEAIRVALGTVDMARRLGCPYAGLWLGQDGYDYPFQVNYRDTWKYELDGVRAAAERAAASDPPIRICIEYKLKEPRMHLTIGDVAKGILVCEEVGMENVGVTLDFGHALMCKESPAESAELLLARHKLFSIHFNDAYRDADDDLIAGALHLWEALELVYYLEHSDYDGWYGLDIFPYREDLVKAAELSIENIERLRRLAQRIDPSTLKELQESGDAMKIHEYVRDVLLPG